MKWNQATPMFTYTPDAVNKAGGQAYSLDKQTEFTLACLTSFLGTTFYEKPDEQVKRIQSLFDAIDSKSAARVAVYARKHFGMRSVSHLVAAIIGAKVKGQKWTREFFEKVIHRPDDILEILACYESLYQKPLPNAMKRGLAAALFKFDEYQLAKYSGKGSKWNLMDACNVLHPKGTTAIRSLVKGTLKAPETWEVKITQAGQQKDMDVSDAKAEAWDSLLINNKLGYFALLRNLRNLIEHCPGRVTEICSQLRNREAIKKSLVLPFRYLTAYEVIENLTVGRQISPQILSAIDDAVDIALDNMPKFDGCTLVALDVSGSMTGKPATIGALFAAAFLKYSNCDLMTFDTTGKYARVMNPKMPTMEIARLLRFSGGGTNFNCIFTAAEREYNRIIILSDMQGWVDNDELYVSLNKYKARMRCNPKIFHFDLNNYGTAMFPQKDIVTLGGFSEKTMELIKLLDEGVETITSAIEAEVL